MKVLVKTPLSPYSGYGNDGIEMLTAMIKRGWDVYVQPMSVQAPLPQHISDLLTKPLTAPFDLYINHTDPMSMEISPEVRATSDVVVGWTMWEYTGFKKIMAESSRRTLRKRLKSLDILVGYSDIDKPLFEPYFSGPIVIQQGGFDPNKWPVIEDRDWDDEKIRFIQHGVLSERKDPFRLIHAFVEASKENEDFARGATLALHTTTPGLHSAITQVYSNIRVFYEVWTTEEVREFYASAHVLVAPSRGEGKNLPALEFMSTGGTVIATNWAGHTQWMSSEYAYPLNYTLEPAIPDYRTDAMNARADIQHLKELLLHCFQNREEVRRKGEIASRVIPMAHSWDRVLGKFVEKLRESLPTEKAERLWALDTLAVPVKLEEK